MSSDIIRKDFRHWTESARDSFVETHSVPVDGMAGFREVTKNFTAWKFTRETNNFRADIIIVELLIEKGTLIFVGQYEAADCDPYDSWGSAHRKVRVDKALVVRQYKATNGDGSGYSYADGGFLRHAAVNGPEVEMSVSDYKTDFSYENGKHVTPTKPFSMENDQCTSGIHIFFEQSDAIDYSGS